MIGTHLYKEQISYDFSKLAKIYDSSKTKKCDLDLVLNLDHPNDETTA